MPTSTWFERLCRGAQIAVLVSVVAVPVALASASPQFRGPDRDGIFPAEGLLQSWPESGPAMVWSTSGLGEGYASVAIADGRLFTTGAKDGKGSIHAFDLEGNRLWSQVYGEVHNGGGYPGTRTTPTVEGGKVFLLSSKGHALAFDATSGEEVWRRDLLTEYEAENLYFGISESPLVVDGNVVFTPGGKKASIVALDVDTGETAWETKGLGQTAAYCNPRLFDNGTHRQIVTLLAKSMVAVDPANGAVLWQQDYPATYDIHAVSPVFHGNLIYVSDGYDQGGKAFRMAEDGRSVSQVWAEEDLDIHHGGTVMLDGRIYGAASKKDWHVLDAESGEKLATLRRLGKGAVVYADGRLYGYVESGKVVLVNPDPENFEVVGELAIDQGEGHHWAHPVIVDSRLYIRHGDALMSYDVAAPQSGLAPIEPQGP